MINTLTIAAVVLLSAALIRVSVRGSSLGLDFNREATVPLRAILALLVVLGHLWSGTGRCCDILRTLACGQSAVSVFFFMSGYGYEKSLQEKGEDYLDGLFLRTLRKLLVPMLLAAQVYYLVMLFSSNDFSPLEQLIGYVHGRTGFLPYSWYVFKLFLLLVVFIFCRKRCGVVGIWAVVVAEMVIFRYVLCWQAAWWVSDLGFPVGLTFAALEPRLRRGLQRHPIGIYALALVLMALVLAVSVSVSPKTSMILTRLPNLLLGPVFALVLYEFRFFGLHWLGTIAYEIYLCQGVFVAPLAGFHLPVWGHVVCAYMGTIGLAFAVHWISAWALTNQEAKL